MRNTHTLEFVRQFTRPMRNCPNHLILDGFSGEWYLVFNFEEDPELDPKYHGTCDIHVVPLMADDYLHLRVVENANKHGVMRFLAALGIQRFDEKTKAAYYAGSGSVLRTMPLEVPEAAQSTPVIYSRSECPFNYCDQPAPYADCLDGCRHRPAGEPS
jgi:hypothetical protein